MTTFTTLVVLALFTGSSAINAYAAGSGDPQSRIQAVVPEPFDTIDQYEGSLDPGGAVSGNIDDGAGNEFDWWCVSVTDGVEFTVTITRTGGSNSFPNCGFAEGVLPEGSQFADFIQTSSTANGSDTTSVTFIITPDFTGDATVWVSSAGSSFDMDYDVTMTGGTKNANCGAADIEILKSVDVAKVDSSDTVTFTIEATNLEFPTATNVSVLDTLPTGADYADHMLTVGTYDQGTGVWDIPTIAEGDTARLTIMTIATGAPGATITNTARVDTLDQRDEVTSNDSASASFDITSVDLRVVKNVSAAMPDSGDALFYTVKVFNDGPDDGNDIEVTDALPGGITYVSHVESDGNYNQNTGLWDIGTLAASDSVTLTINFDVSGDPGQTVLNSASVTNARETDPVPGNNSDSASFTITSSDLRITKTASTALADSGDTVQYRVTLENLGPDEATTIEVEDILPAGVTYDIHAESSGTYNNGTGLWTIPVVASADSAVLTIDVTVTGNAGLTVTNTARVTSADQADPNYNNNSDSASFRITSADIEIQKTVSLDSAAVGEFIEFFVTATNVGPDPATGVEVKDLITGGGTYDSHTETSGTSFDPGTGIWTVGAIDSASNATLTIRVEMIGAPGDTVFNTAWVTAADQTDPVPGNNSDTAFARITSVDLDVAKSVTPTAMPDSNQVVKYRVVLRNLGLDPGSGIVLQDSLPAGLSYESHSPSPGTTYDEVSGIWTVGNLAPSDSVTLEVDARVTGSPGDMITNTAAVIAIDQGDPDTGNNQDSETITVTSADLRIAKSVSEALPDSGQTVQYHVTLVNDGPDDAFGVQVTDLLPSGVQHTGHTPPPGTSYDENTGLWDIGVMIASDSLTLEIDVTAVGSPGDSIVNTASVTASDQADPDYGNNTASVGLRITSADLEIVKTVNVPEPDSGQTVTYTVTLRNQGPDQATNVVVTDNLPGDVTHVSHTESDGDYDENTGLWTVPTLAASDSVVLDIDVIASGTLNTTITNTATVTAADQADPDYGNNSASADIRIRAVDLTLVKSVLPTAMPDSGTTITYQVRLTNAGPDSANNVQVTDQLPAGTSYFGHTSTLGTTYDSGTGIWDIGVVNLTDTLALDIEATVTGNPGSMVVNWASVTQLDEADLNYSDNADSAKITVTSVDLQVVKTVDIAQPDSGQTVQYRVTVLNNGVDSASGVFLTDQLPAGVTYDSHNESQGNYTQGSGIWDIGAIAVNDSAYMTIDVIASGALNTTITNTASITAADQADPVPGNNSDSADIRITSVDIDLDKTVDNAMPDSASTVQFRIRVRNDGVDAATGLQVTDLLPTGVNYITHSVTPPGSSYTSGNGLWNINNLAVSDSVVLLIDATVTGAPGDTITNYASVTALDQADPNYANNSDTAGLRVTSADLQIVKTATEATPDSGATFFYNIKLKNNGPDTATNIDITDNLPAGVTYVDHVASNGTYSNGTGVWMLPSLAAPDSATLDIEVIASGVPNQSITNTATITAVDQADPSPGNNADSTMVRITSADLSIAKTISDTKPDSGQTITYRIALRNAGPDSAYAIDVLDQLPAGVTYDSDDSGGDYDTGTGIWSVAALAANDSLILNIDAIVTGTPGATYTNTASIQASEQADPNYGNNSDSVDFTITSADLEVQKTVSNNSPNSGEMIEFFVTVTNKGPDQATGVEITDVMTPNAIYDNHTATAGTSFDSGTGIWTVGAIDSAANATLTLFVTATGAPGDSVINTAWITAADQSDPVAGNNADSVIAIIKSVDLELVKTVDVALPDSGATIHYNLVLRNNGSGDATGVEVTDQLPAGVSYVTHTPSGTTSYNDGTGIWDIGAVANGDSATLDIEAIVTAGPGDLVTNTGTITDADQADPDTGNNTASVNFTVRSVDLQVIKTVSSTMPDSGQTVEWTVRLFNAGPDSASGVEVTDLLPAGVTHVSNTPPGSTTYNPGTGLWDIGTIAPLDTLPLVITTTVDAGPGQTVVNTATVTASNSADPNYSNNSDSDTITVTDVDLKVVKTINNAMPDSAATVTYTVKVFNLGADPASGVQVTDQLPAGVQHLSNSPEPPSTYDFGTGIWDIGALAVNDSITLTIDAEVTATSSQTVTNTATVTAADQADPDPSNNSDSVDFTVTGADLQVTKSVNDSMPDEGQSITYTICATNAGPDSAYGVEVFEPLSLGVNYLSDTPTQGSYNNTNGIWDIGALALGDTVYLDINVMVDAGPGSTVDNTATITGNQSDPNYTNNTASASFTVRSVDLEVTKTVSNGSPSVGDSIDFFVTVTNKGPDTAQNVVLRDSLGTGVTYITHTATTGTSFDEGTGIWTVGSIDSAANRTLTITVEATGSPGDTLTNTAWITAGDISDPDKNNNQATAIAIINSVDLELLKTVSNTMPDSGSTQFYEIVLRNNGDGDATGVQVTDLLPTGAQYADHTLTTGSYDENSGLWDVGSILDAASDTLSIEFLVTASSGDSVINVASITAADQSDPDSGNNTANARFDVTSVDLQVFKVVDLATPDSAATINYEVKVRNNGVDAGTGIQLTDLLPAGVDYVDHNLSQGNYTQGNGLWDIGNIAAGDSVILDIEAIVTSPPCSTVINTATITAMDQTDPNYANNSASASFTQSCVDLLVDKRVSEAMPDSGTAQTYTIKVFNQGDDPASSVEVTDVLPSGATYTGDNPIDGSYDDGSGVWTIGVIAAADSACLEISFDVTAPPGSTVTNTATVTAMDQADRDHTNNSASVDFTVTATELVLTKTVSETRPDSASTISYTIKVQNNGPDDATGLAITDQLPTGVAYFDHTLSTGTYTPGSGLWDIGTQLNGGLDSLVIDVVVDGDPLQMIKNIAAVTALNESNTGNDSTSVDITVKGADLVLSKMVDNANPDSGSTATYTLVVRNDGPDGVTAAVVDDLLPSGMTYVTHGLTQGTYDEITGIWDIGAMANADTDTLTIDAQVTGTPGSTISNYGRITSEVADPDYGNNGDNADIDITPGADLDLIKTVNDAKPDSGQTITYRLRLRNLGPNGATGVAVKDSLPDGVSFNTATPSPGTSYDDGTGIWTIGALAASDSVVLTIDADVTAGPGVMVTNTASVSASDQPDPNSSNDTDDAKFTVTSTDLMVSKTVNEAMPDSGATITYRVVLRNAGPDSATGLEITDMLPGGVTYFDDTPSQGSYNDGTGIWTIGAVANGDSATLDIEAIVTSPPGTSITNTAFVSKQDQADPDYGNNSDSVDITVDCLPVISGTVKYHTTGRDIFPYQPDPGALGVTVRTTDNAVSDYADDATYSLPLGSGPATVTITAERPKADCDSVEAFSINGADLLLVQDVIKDQATISLRDSIAADVDKDGMILGTDALAIRQWIAKVACSDDCFGNNCAGTWKFIFPTGPNPEDFVTDSLTVTDLCTDSTIAIEGVILGDANHSWPFPQNPGPITKPSAVPLGFDVVRIEGDAVTLSVSALSNAALDHVIYSLDYDATEFEYVEMSLGGAVEGWGHLDNPATAGVTHGIIHRLSGQDALRESGDVIFFKFRALTDNPTSSFSFSRLMSNDIPVEVPDVAAADTRTPLPMQYSLGNYPNPFNPMTKVQFAIPAGVGEVPVELRIYDISGRLVRILLRDRREPGFHEVVWNGTDNRGAKVGAGIYFVRIRAGDWVSTQKMALVK